MTRAKPKVAVLLAAYNGVGWIEEQIITILDQSDVCVKIFISIDKSTDGTEKLVNQLKNRHNEIFVLPYGARYGSAATNFYNLIKNADIANFDYVAFADQDDIWFKNKLIRAIKLLEEKKCDGYSSNVIAFWFDGRRRLIDKAQPQQRWDYLFEAPGPGCTFVMKVELMSEIKEMVIREYGHVRDVNCHDLLCYAYARSKGFKWIIDCEASLLYRQHLTNQLGANVGIEAFKNRYRAFSSGRWLVQAIYIAKIVGLDNSAFVKKWVSLNRVSIFYLALSFWICRRKVIDKFAFFIFCIILVFKGRNKHD